VKDELQFDRAQGQATINQVGEKNVHSFLNQHKPLSACCKESTLLQSKRRLLPESMLNWEREQCYKLVENRSNLLTTNKMLSPRVLCFSLEFSSGQWIVSLQWITLQLLIYTFVDISWCLLYSWCVQCVSWKEDLGLLKLMSRLDVRVTFHLLLLVKVFVHAWQSLYTLIVEDIVQTKMCFSFPTFTYEYMHTSRELWESSIILLYVQ